MIYMNEKNEELVEWLESMSKSCKAISRSLKARRIDRDFACMFLDGTADDMDYMIPKMKDNQIRGYIYNTPSERKRE